MNQSILFNDDFKYNLERQAFQFTGFVNSQLVTIYIEGANKDLTTSDKFMFEEQVEEWLEEHEPSQDNVINL